MSEWEKYTLGEISKNISYGYTESATTECIGPKFLRITDIVGKLDWNTVPYCKIDDKNYLKYKLEIGDIVIARTGATTGATEIIKDKVDAVFASYLIRYQINETIANPFYVSYVLKSNYWKNFVSSIIGGSAQPGANAKQFANFEIKLPPLSTQTQIASILTSFDNKIELLEQMNQTLETMAQTIFKEWFVNFNFPGFDGELVDGLAKGWRKGKLGEVLNLLYGKALKAENRALGIFPVIGSSGIVGFHNTFVVNGPGIVIGRKGTIGEVIWVYENFFPIDTTFFVEDMIDVTELYYHYYLLKEQNFKKLISDSAVPGLNRNQALGTELVFPDVNIVKKFNNVIAPFFRKKESNLTQIRTLTQLRDTLLPKFMSGQVKINTDCSRYDVRNS